MVLRTECIYCEYIMEVTVVELFDFQEKMKYFVFFELFKGIRYEKYFKVF